MFAWLHSICVFELNLRNTVLVLLVTWLIWFNFACNTQWVEIGKIKHHKYKMHATRGAYGGKDAKTRRVYVIAGGSGFVGSWIARYLLARDEKSVYILDRRKPPSDVLKHGAIWVDIDLMFTAGIEREFSRFHELADETCHIIVYNCSLVKRYDLPNFRADLGVATAEILYIALRWFNLRRVFIIDVSDSMAHRQPIRNWDRFYPTPNLWCQEAVSDIRSPDKEESSRDMSFSSYAWHQLQVEAMTLRAPSVNAAVSASAVLKVEGIPSGHLGDCFLGPCIKAGWTFCHSPNVPITIVNVEDIARACLSLEHLLLDPETRDDANGKEFTVGSSEVTSISEVLKYIQSKRRNFWVIYLPPALVFAVTWVMSLVYVGKPENTRGPLDTLLRIRPSTLTFARFYTASVGQIPNPQNEKRQKEVLGLHNNFTLSQTLDGLLEDIDLKEKRQMEKKNRS